MRPESTGRAPRRRRLRPAATHAWRALVDWTCVGLLVSGAAWLVARYWLVTETEFGSVTPAWAAKALAIHGGFAMLSLLAMGAWLPTHVLPRLRQGIRLATGAAQLALLAVLIVSGYGLYYFADETTRPTWSMIHWGTGVALCTLLLIHRRPGQAAGHDPASHHRRHGGHRTR